MIYINRMTYFFQIITNLIGKEAIFFQLRTQMNRTNIKDKKLIEFKTIIAIATPSKQHESFEGSHEVQDIYNCRILIYYDLYLNYQNQLMAYLDREESIKVWAALVTGIQVGSLRKIQQPSFVVSLLKKLDHKYFDPIFKNHSEDNYSLSQLYKYIIKYYKSQIGTNIKHLIGEQINIYSNSNIEDAWELMLGIAIKGNNREQNINLILKMDGKYQEELGRIVSKVITMFGENVSQLQTDSSISNSNNYETNNDIVFEISEQNQQLKQKIDEYLHEISQLEQTIKNLKKQVEVQGKLKKNMIQIMLSEDIQNSDNFHQHMETVSSQLVISQFFREVIQECSRKGKEIHKKEQKLQSYEDTIKDLKLAYSTMLLELQDYRKMFNQNNAQTYSQQTQLEDLRRENREYAIRQNQWLQKIEELNQQKFYLKGIVERLQKQNNFTPQKIQKLVALKINQKTVEKSRLLEQTQFTKNNQNLDNFIQKTLPVPKKDDIISKTVQYQIDELKEPSIRNKLQREVSHLQKKINSLTSQNLSLKKINNVLEKVINDFTKDNESLTDKIQKEYEPAFKEFQDKIRKIISQKSKEESLKQKEYEQIFQEIAEAFRQKTKNYEKSHYQLIAKNKKLEQQRNALLRQLKLQTEVREQIVKITQKLQQQQPLQKLNQLPNQNNIQNQQATSSPNQEQQKLGKVQQEQNQQFQIKIKSQVNSQQKRPLQNINTQQSQFLSTKIQTPKKKMESIIIHEDEEQDIVGANISKYSYMRTRKSCLQEQNLMFKEKQVAPSEILVGTYSYIQQKDQQCSEDSSIEHIQIIDVGEIEEELEKIKRKYLSISEKNVKFCQNIIKQYEQNQDRENKIYKKQIKEIFQVLKRQIGQSKDKNHEQSKFINKNLKQVQEYIKLCHENKVIKSQLAELLKERKVLRSQLSSFQFTQQTHEVPSQDKRHQQLLKKSYRIIKELQRILEKTTLQYIDLQNYFSDAKNLKKCQQNNSLKQALEVKVAGMEKDITNKNYEIQSLIQENKLLISALLEWRNMGNKNNCKNSIKEQRQKAISSEREELPTINEIINRSRHKSINLRPG